MWYECLFLKVLRFRAQCHLILKLQAQRPWSLCGPQVRQKHNGELKSFSKIHHKIFHYYSTALNICMENASLTLADMASLKNLIEAATARGAFRANEMSTVGNIYDKLDAFLTATQAQLAAQAEAQQPAEPTQGE